MSATLDRIMKKADKAIKELSEYGDYKLPHHKIKYYGSGSTKERPSGTLCRDGRGGL